MPRVPTYTRQIAYQSLPAARASAPDTSGLSASITGGVLSGIGALQDEQRKADASAVTRAYGDLMKAQTDVMYGTREAPGLYGRTGGDYLQYEPEARRDFQRRYDAILGSLSGEQVTMFQERAQASMLDWNERLSKGMAQAVMDKKTTDRGHFVEGVVGLAARDAENGGIRIGPRGNLSAPVVRSQLKAIAGSAYDNAEAIMQAKGLDNESEAIKEYIDENTDALHRQVIASLIASGQTREADAYVKEYGDQLLTEHRAAIVADVRQRMTKARVEQAASRLVVEYYATEQEAAANNTTQASQKAYMMDALARIEDADIRKAVGDRAQEMWSDRNAVIEQDRAETGVQMSEAIDQGTSLATLQADAARWGKLTGKQRDILTAQAEHPRATSLRVPRLQLDLYLATGERPKGGRVDVDDPLSWRSFLSKPDYEKRYADWLSMRQSGAVTQDSGTTRAKRKDTIAREVWGADYLTTDSEIKAFSQWDEAVERAVAQWGRANPGKEMDDEKFTSIARMMMVETAIDAPWRWADKRVYELTPSELRTMTVDDIEYDDIDAGTRAWIADQIMKPRPGDTRNIQRRMALYEGRLDEEAIREVFVELLRANLLPPGAQ
jgi:hypothetical protein